jgi:hypothetical protein
LPSDFVASNGSESACCFNCLAFTRSSVTVLTCCDRVFKPVGKNTFSGVAIEFLSAHPLE